MPTISIETSGFEQARQALSPGLYQSAIVAALNEDIAKVRTKANREVRQVYNVKARTVRDAMTVRRATRGNLESIMLTGGDRIELKEFSARPRRVGRRLGVSVVIRRRAGRKLVKGAFIVARREGNIYKRKGRERYPIRKRFGPSVPQMVRVAGIWEPLIAFAQAEFPRLFAGQLRRRLDKIK